MEYLKQKYKTDPTGQLADNRIVNERHTLSPSFRVIFPHHSPYFSESLSIVHNGRTLVQGTDYKFTNLDVEINKKVNKPVYNAITFLDELISGDVYLTYQTYGEVVRPDVLAQYISAIRTDERDVYWKNILNKPKVFPPEPHKHHSRDIVGLAPVGASLYEIVMILRSMRTYASNHVYKVLEGLLTSTNNRLDDIDRIVRNLRNTETIIANIRKGVDSQISSIREEILAGIGNINSDGTIDSNVIEGLRSDYIRRINEESNIRREMDDNLTTRLDGLDSLVNSLNTRSDGLASQLTGLGDIYLTSTKFEEFKTSNERQLESLSSQLATKVDVSTVQSLINNTTNPNTGTPSLRWSDITNKPRIFEWNGSIDQLNDAIQEGFYDVRPDSSSSNRNTLNQPTDEVGSLWVYVHPHTSPSVISQRYSTITGKVLTRRKVGTTFTPWTSQTSTGTSGGISWDSIIGKPEHVLNPFTKNDIYSLLSIGDVSDEFVLSKLRQSIEGRKSFESGLASRGLMVVSPSSSAEGHEGVPYRTARMEVGDDVGEEHLSIELTQSGNSDEVRMFKLNYDGSIETFKKTYDSDSYRTSDKRKLVFEDGIHWSMIKGIPLNLTNSTPTGRTMFFRPPTTTSFNELTDKPEFYPTHWNSLQGIPERLVRNPSWNDLTDVPVNLTRNVRWEEIDDKPTYFKTRWNDIDSVPETLKRLKDVNLGDFISRTGEEQHILKDVYFREGVNVGSNNNSLSLNLSSDRGELLVNGTHGLVIDRATGALSQLSPDTTLSRLITENDFNEFTRNWESLRSKLVGITSNDKSVSDIVNTNGKVSLRLLPNGVTDKHYSLETNVDSTLSFLRLNESGVILDDIKLPRDKSGTIALLSDLDNLNKHTDPLQVVRGKTNGLTGVLLYPETSQDSINFFVGVEDDNIVFKKAGNYTVTIPKLDGEVLLTNGNQTINGKPKFNSGLLIANDGVIESRQGDFIIRHNRSSNNITLKSNGNIEVSGNKVLTEGDICHPLDAITPTRGGVAQIKRDGDNYILRVGNQLSLNHKGRFAKFTLNQDGVVSSSNPIRATLVSETSDRRVKSNITKIEDALGKLSKLSGYTFTLDELNGLVSAGVIAQEVLEVLPEVVSQNEDGKYSVSYNGLIGLLIQGINELHQKYEVRLGNLEEQVKELLNR